jgi:Glyoxalase superfamily protein
MSLKILESIPILRIFSVEKAKESYVEFLGLAVDWEHRFDERAPIYHVLLLFVLWKVLDGLIQSFLRPLMLLKGGFLKLCKHRLSLLTQSLQVVEIEALLNM